jgi:transposase InsO family protein
MTEEQQMQVAVFRFGVISEFVNGAAISRDEKQRLLRNKSARKWQIPFSEKTRISRGTIKRWVRLYTDSNGNLKALFPKDRSDKGRSRAIDDETAVNLIQLRKQLPEATIAQLIEQMHVRTLVSAGTELKPTTVYRFLHQHQLMNPVVAAACDRRKFEAALPNELWQSDVMHGPKIQVDGKRRKTYLIAFIDDHSRLVPYGQFYLSERLASYLHALQKALLKRGVPRKLYVDNGPAFRSKHLQYVTASLGIALIHSKPYKPQGRGKIERFFRTVRGQFFTGFKGNHLTDLNQAFDLWLEHVYHQRNHSATGHSPFKRFTADMHCIRPAPQNLKDYFRKMARRKVAKDRTITLNGKLFEAPIKLIGKRVELLYHDDDLQQVEIIHQQQSYGVACPVDVYVNCRVKRDKNNNAQIQPASKSSTYQGGKLL